MVAVAKGKPKPRTSFGQRLRAMREAAGLSAAQLGELAGMTAQSINKYERGAAEPMWAIVQRLAEALDAPTDRFRDSDGAKDENGPPPGKPKKK